MNAWANWVQRTPGSRFSSKLVEHFRAYRRRQPWDFCWRVTLEGLAVSLAAAVVMWCLGVPELKITVSRRTLVVAAIAVAPIVETLLFQALPIECARLFRAGLAWQVAWATALFCFLHAALNGVGSGVAAGLIGGFYFAFTYAHWRGRSRWTAFWTTGLSHAMSNAAAVCLGIACGEI